LGETSLGRIVGPDISRIGAGLSYESVEQESVERECGARANVEGDIMEGESVDRPSFEEPSEDEQMLMEPTNEQGNVRKPSKYMTDVNGTNRIAIVQN
jgi:hypothetical protein